MKIAQRIQEAYTARFSDSGQIIGYVKWNDAATTTGNPAGEHMQALLKRAQREGVLTPHREF